MDVKVVLSLDEILRGLKHYRRIAKQDLLRADDTDDPERFRAHAEARRSVYAWLTELAESQTPSDVVREALEHYRTLPFVTGTPDQEHVDIKAREKALENFFLMIGLEPKIRREVRSSRPKLADVAAQQNTGAGGANARLS
ncbi:MAG: hypothetical protein U5L04_12940 [Trueperaceae bacterium]|nr:hypothetical protein [Trueperaceae bacterium]